MIWFLVLVGILLILLGAWGGPPQRKRPDKASRIPREATVQEAWEILTSPVQYEEELIKIPEHKPWYIPGGDRRFYQGLLVGLGLGLMGIALLSPFLAPREPAQPETAAKPPAAQTGPVGERPAGQVPPTAQPGQQADQQGGLQGEQSAGQQGGQQAGEQGGQQAASQSPAPPKPALVTFTVEPGSSSQEIAAGLKAAGLIADEQAFLRVVTERGVETQLKAGTFTIPADAGVDRIIEELTR